MKRSMKNEIPAATRLLGRLTGRRRVIVLVAGLAIAAASYLLWNHLADAARPWRARARVQHYLQIAMACEEAGDLKQAVRWWQQIQNTNDYRWMMRRLPELKLQLARK